MDHQSYFETNHILPLLPCVKTRPHLISPTSYLRPSEKAVKGVIVKTYPVDVADRDALADALNKVRGDLGQPECIFYNAARVTQTKALDCSLDEMEYDFKM